MYDFFGFPPYVSVEQRRANARALARKLQKKGHTVKPVVIQGRSIASTFWGKAWCDNLEAYSDFANRLPRGRTYARNGSVFDLQILPGRVTALVSGSEIYEVEISLAELPKKRWSKLVEACAGSIDSAVELLAGRLSDGVMEILCRKGKGLFPAPEEIELSCSCPDGAWLCKHLAASLYGVGARLDEKPELLFKLRQVDHRALVGAAARGAVAIAPAKSQLDPGGLADIFGIELEETAAKTPARPKGKGKGKKAAPRRRVRAAARL